MEKRTNPSPSCTSTRTSVLGNIIFVMQTEGKTHSGSMDLAI